MINKIENKIIKLKNNKEILICEATQNDAEEFYNYLKKVGSETDFLTFGNEGIGSIDDNKNFLKQLSEKNNCIGLFSKYNSKIIGCITFHGGTRERIKHIGDFGLTVLKDYWNLGIGSILLKTIIEWIKENNIIKKINLRVRTDNKRAIQLYKNFGFKKEGKIRRSYIINNKYYDDLIMGLEIN